MRSPALAKRYAKALVNLASRDLKTCELYLSALNHVNELFALKIAKQCLVSPVMPKGLKKDLLDYALTRIGDEAGIRGFLFSMVDAGRVGLIPEMIDEFSNALDDMSNRVKAKVTTAMPLESELIAELTMVLKAVLNKEPILEKVVDQSVLGGLVLRLGNRMLDLSISTKIASIRP